MKKAIAILLVLLVAGVAFGADVVLTYTTSTGNTDLIINAVQGTKTTFTLTQSTTIGTTAAPLDLDSDSTDAFNTTTGVAVAEWELFSTHRGGLTLGWSVANGGFTSTVGEGEAAETVTVPYELNVAGEGFQPTDNFTTTTYTGFSRTGNGAYLPTTEGNFRDIMVRRLQAHNDVDYVSGVYSSTITLTITAN